VLLAIWTVVELRTSTPLVDLRLLALRPVALTNATTTFAGYTMFAASFVIPQILSLPTGLDHSVAVTGLLMAPAPFGMLSASLLAGRLAPRYGSKPALIAGQLFSVLIYSLLAWKHDNSALIAVLMFGQGAAAGAAYTAVSSMIVQAVPSGQTGEAAGVNSLARSVGQALGGQASAAILTASLTAAALPSDRGFTTALLVAAAVAGCGTLVGSLIPLRNSAAGGSSPAVHAGIPVRSGAPVR
jgi:MFS family permease